MAPQGRRAHQGRRDDRRDLDRQGRRRASRPRDRDRDRATRGGGSDGRCGPGDRADRGLRRRRPHSRRPQSPSRQPRRHRRPRRRRCKTVAASRPSPREQPRSTASISQGCKAAGRPDASRRPTCLPQPTEAPRRHPPLPQKAPERAGAAGRIAEHRTARGRCRARAIHGELAVGADGDELPHDHGERTRCAPPGAEGGGDARSPSHISSRTRSCAPPPRCR